MSGAALVSDGSHHVVVMRLGQDRFLHGIGGLKVTVSSGIFFGLSPQLGLDSPPSPENDYIRGESEKHASTTVRVIPLHPQPKR
jgi:hypothetical protein